jgi:hypothetical protein
MKLLLKLSVLVLGFVIGLFANVLVDRAAHYFIPDVDPQPKATQHLQRLSCGVALIKSLMSQFEGR